MFKGKIYVYKIVNGEKEEITREFDNEKDFSEFIKKNPSLAEAKKFSMENMRWPTSLFDIRGFLEDAETLGHKEWVSEIEEDLKKIFRKTNKLLK